jgi:DNA-binding LacI/PurR family transcriptional regulator
MKLSEVASRAGVSTATVSRALNHQLKVVYSIDKELS